MKVQVIPRFPAQVKGVAPITVSNSGGVISIGLSGGGGSGGVTQAYVDAQDAQRVLKNGDVMTGRLTLPGDPTASLHAATKQYVDSHSGVSQAYVDTQDGLRVLKSGDVMSGLLTLSGDPGSPMNAATKQYVDNLASGLVVKSNVLMATTANIALSGEQTIDGVLTSASRVLVKNQTAPAQNGVYVSAVGAWVRAADIDTWTETFGAYTFVKSGTVNGSTGWVAQTTAGGTIDVTAMPWAQFNSSATGSVPLAGGTMSGLLILSGDPVVSLGASTKQYVDTQGALKAPIASPSFTGDPTAPTPAPGDNDTSIATTAFVGAAITAAGVAVLPATAAPLMDGAAAVGTSIKYAREDHRHPTDTSRATVSYVDAQDALRVAKLGDTMTGPLILSGDPVVPLGAATKQYVDSQVSRTVIGAGPVAVLTTDRIILIAKTVSAVTDVNLPAAATFLGNELFVKDLNGVFADFPAAVNPSAGENIDGQTSWPMSLAYSHLLLGKKTNGWYVKGQL